MERRMQRAWAVASATAAVLASAALPVLVALVVGVGVGAVDVPRAGAQGCAPRLAVSRTSGLAPEGETITVSGSCYDVTKGVYVAFCVVPPPGSVPSPCGGGVDMSGANGLSHWISSDPPPQGVGLTSPYGPGGSFTVTMRPSSQLNAGVDCRRVSCAVVTRNDHTRSSDRSQDVIVPVTFAAVAAVLPDLPALPALPAIAPPPDAPPVTEAPPADAVAPDEPPATTAPDGTATTAGGAPSSVAEAGDGPEGDELALDAASSTSGGSGAGPMVGVVAAVVLLGAGAAGWWVLRRRRGDAAQAGGGA